MKILICGSRNITDYERCVEYISKIIKTNALTPTVIIHGGARGADTIANTFAIQHRLPTLVFKPDWSTGKSAGYIRNGQMVEIADAVIAIWDGQSRGTNHTINLGIEKGVPTFVVNY